jgi:hypothetical protein
MGNILSPAKKTEKLFDKAKYISVHYGVCIETISKQSWHIL